MFNSHQNKKYQNSYRYDEPGTSDLNTVYDEPQTDITSMASNTTHQSSFSPDIFITDDYYPGFMEDAVHQRVNFNEMIAKQGKAKTSAKPIPRTLIEAFDQRVQHELNVHKSNVNQPDEISNLLQQTKSPTQTTRNDLKNHREEIIRAHTIAVDINALMRNQPNTELMRAIDCLQKAEMMNDFDQAVLAAEQGVHSRDEQHVARARCSQTFETGKITEVSTSVPGTGTLKPLEIVSYLGITKPVHDN